MLAHRGGVAIGLRSFLVTHTHSIIQSDVKQGEDEVSE